MERGGETAGAAARLLACAARAGTLVLEGFLMMGTAPGPGAHDYYYVPAPAPDETPVMSLSDIEKSMRNFRQQLDRS